MIANMEPKLQQTYLYDFYGELLNAHQQQVFEDFVFNDLSLAEIAQEQDISRQAVHDMVRRSTKKLEEYEKRLHLIARFLELREKAAGIQQRVIAYEQSHEEHLLEEIGEISKEIIKDL